MSHYGEGPISTVQHDKIAHIVEALDIGENKSAMKLGQTYLKHHSKSKDATLMYVVGIVALAHARSHNNKEALELLDSHFSASVLPDGVDDEGVLNLLSMVYLRLHRPEEGLRLWEKQHARAPNREYVTKQLFFGHCKTLSLNKMQQVANKLKGADAVYWMALCALLQVTHFGAPVKVAELAQLILKRAPADAGPDSSLERLWIHMHVLKTIGKPEEALELLKLESSEKLFSEKHLYLTDKAELLVLLGRKDEAKAVYRSLITGHDYDGWGYYKGFFDLASAAEARELVAEMLARPDTRDKEIIRGPRIANIEVESRHGTAETVIAAIKSYLVRFGDLNSAFDDLRRYLVSAKLTENGGRGAQLLHGELEQMLKESLATYASAAPETNVKPFVRRQIALHRLLFALTAGKHRSLELVRNLVQVYFRVLVERDETTSKETLAERQTGDDALLLACEMLLAMHNDGDSGAGNMLLYMLHLLHIGLKHSTKNYHITLMMLEIFNKLGLLVQAYMRFAALDIKHVLTESMSHFAIEDNISMALFPLASRVMSDVLRFHTDSGRDMPDLFANVFRDNCYHKAEEFLRFHSVLRNSLQAAICAVESRWIDLPNLACDVEGRDVAEMIKTGLDIGTLDPDLYATNDEMLQKLENSLSFDSKWTTAPMLDEGKVNFLKSQAVSERISSFSAANDIAPDLATRRVLLKSRALMLKIVRNMVSVDSAATCKNLNADIASLKTTLAQIPELSSSSTSSSTKPLLAAGQLSWRVLTELSEAAAPLLVTGPDATAHAAVTDEQVAAFGAAVRAKVLPAVAALKPLVTLEKPFAGVAGGETDVMTSVPLYFRLSGKLIYDVVSPAMMQLRAVRARIPASYLKRGGNNKKKETAADANTALLAVVRETYAALREITEHLSAELKSIDGDMAGQWRAVLEDLQTVSIPAELQDAEIQKEVVDAALGDWKEIIKSHQSVLQALGLALKT